MFGQRASRWEQENQGEEMGAGDKEIRAGRETNRNEDDG